jgi:hypothetical protein
MGKVHDFLFGRDPVLLLSLLSALLGVLTVFHVLGFSATQVPLILAVITAVIGAAQAAYTRPWLPAAFIAVIGALAELAAGYGFHVSDAVVAAIDGVIVAIPPLLVRAQATPTLKLRKLAAVERRGGPPRRSAV